jgi:hypothetical protein
MVLSTQALKYVSGMDALTVISRHRRVVAVVRAASSFRAAFSQVRLISGP